MPYGLYLSAEGAHAQSKRLEVIANNLANVDTAGFKRHLAIFQARYAEETARGADTPGSGTINDLGGGIEVLQTAIDFSPGNLKHTGVPTDMAIKGDGFFMVEKDGRRFLTRAGNFSLSPTGQLIARRGADTYAVLGDGGAPIVIDPTLGPWEVTSWGGIRQAGSLQNIAVVAPENLAELVPVGHTLFEFRSSVQPVPLAQRQVASGYLETAAVQPTLEMIELIETTRAIEANLNMMQTQDEMMSALVNRVMRS